MKDAYSFHLDQASLDETYRSCTRPTPASSAAWPRLSRRACRHGAIGGSLSHEFHVLADSGEDAIAFSSEGDYAANVELAEALRRPPAPDPVGPMATVDTPGQHTIDEVSAFLATPPERCLKTLSWTGRTAGS